MPGNRAQPFDLGGPTTPPQGANEDFALAPASAGAPANAPAPAPPSAEPSPGSDLPPLDLAAAEVAQTVPEPSPGPLYLATALASLVLVAAPIAYLLTRRRPAGVLADPNATGQLGLILVAAAAFLWIAAYLVQQGRRLAADARRARMLAESLL
ncbi:MAG TPA: hypothetical protein VKT30_06150, partial [Caulobacteraceae bacterium]|nr:hypothetical protein [Caulobacteraceae bacterium]